MYPILLQFHSVIRYIVLIMLIVVIVQSLIGMMRKDPYSKMHNRTGLFLFMTTHMQLLIGLILFFVSPAVQFSGTAMKDAGTRYWLVEHNTAMLIAIVLITLARTTSKKMVRDSDKHKRLFIFNVIALAIILVTIYLSGRDII